jgi:hypothetical protein
LDDKMRPGAVAMAGVFAGPRNQILRHKTVKQQTNTPTPGDAHSTALASAEEMSSLPKLQGNRQNR